MAKSYLDFVTQQLSLKTWLVQRTSIALAIQAQYLIGNNMSPQEEGIQLVQASSGSLPSDFPHPFLTIHFPEQQTEKWINYESFLRVMLQCFLIQEKEKEFELEAIIITWESY